MKCAKRSVCYNEIMKSGRDSQVPVDQNRIKKIVDLSVKRFGKTYTLFDQYDKDPGSTPEYLTERRAVQEELRTIPT